MNIYVLRTGLLVLGALCVVGEPQTAQAAEGDQDRLSKITAFFKMNVTAEAFRAYCDDDQKIKTGLNYLANTAAVDVALAKALMAVRPELSLTQSRVNVKRREQVFKKSAYKEFQASGCDTDKGRASYEHIKKLNKPRPSQMLAYLRNL